jgi:hypothetical protein
MFTGKCFLLLFHSKSLFLLLLLLLLLLSLLLLLRLLLILLLILFCKISLIRSFGEDGWITKGGNKLQPKQSSAPTTNDASSTNSNGAKTDSEAIKTDSGTAKQIEPTKPNAPDAAKLISINVNYPGVGRRGKVMTSM